MADLKEEYMDLKNRTHPVEHIVVRAEDKNSREDIMEELLRALTVAGKTPPA